MKEKLISIFFWILRICMSGFFLVISIKKIYDLEKLQSDIEKFQIFPDSWAVPFSYLGVSCEIVIALGLLWSRVYSGAALLGALMTGMFTMLFLQGWVRDLSLQCNCLGVERPVESYGFEVSWRFGLFVLFLTLLWDSIRRERLPHNTLKLDFSQV